MTSIFCSYCADCLYHLNPVYVPEHGNISADFCSHPNILVRSEVSGRPIYPLASGPVETLCKANNWRILHDSVPSIRSA